MGEPFYTTPSTVTIERPARSISGRVSLAAGTYDLITRSGAGNYLVGRPGGVFLCLMSGDELARAGARTNTAKESTK